MAEVGRDPDRLLTTGSDRRQLANTANRQTTAFAPEAISASDHARATTPSELSASHQEATPVAITARTQRSPADRPPMPERVRVGPERWPSDRNNEQWVATEPLAHEAPPPENATDRPRFGHLLTGASQQASRALALAWLTRFDRSCKRVIRPWPRLSSRGSSSDGCAADAERGASAFAQ